MPILIVAIVDTSIFHLFNDGRAICKFSESIISQKLRHVKRNLKNNASFFWQVAEKHKKAAINCKNTLTNDGENAKNEAVQEIFLAGLVCFFSFSLE
jgi:hypothetical protein